MSSNKNWFDFTTITTRRVFRRYDITNVKRYLVWFWRVFSHGFQKGTNEGKRFGTQIRVASLIIIIFSRKIHASPEERHNDRSCATRAAFTKSSAYIWIVFSRCVFTRLVNSSALLAICSTNNLACPLPLKLSNSLGYVDNSGSSTDLRSRKETSSIVLSIALWVTLSLLIVANDFGTQICVASLIIIIISRKIHASTKYRHKYLSCVACI